MNDKLEPVWIVEYLKMNGEWSNKWMPIHLRNPKNFYEGIAYLVAHKGMNLDYRMRNAETGEVIPGAIFV